MVGMTGRIPICDRAAGIMADNVHLLLDGKMLCEKQIEVICHQGLRVITTFRLGRTLSAAVVWNDEAIACGGRWLDDAPVLVRGFREAVDEEHRPFERTLRWSISLVDSYRSVCS